MHALATPAFLAALRQNHDAPVRVTARTPAGQVVLGRVTGGQVDVDRAAKVRRRCTLSVVDEGGLLIPQGPVRLLSQQAVVTSKGSSATFPSGTRTLVTDGVVTTDPYFSGQDGPESWVQIDLGSSFRLGSVKVWHYFGDGRTYVSPRTEVSQDGVVWTVVSRPQQYPETSAGQTRTFDPVLARYVRDYVSGSVQFPNTSEWVEVQVFTAPDVLSAYGGEVVLERGVTTPAGVTTYVPLGVFRVALVAVDDKGAGVILQVAGFDRAASVARARFVTPYAIAAGTNVGTAIAALISNRVAGLTYAITPTTRTTPVLLFDTGADPWEAVEKMAEAIGYEVFFDPDGVLVARPEPDPAVSAIADTYREGADSHLLGAGKALDTDSTYSRVVVTGEAGDAALPVRAEATDAALAALLGDVPFFITSAFITSQAQAQDVADATLRRVQALTEQVKVEAIVNPALDGGDVVRVVRDAVLLDAVYVVDSFTVPLAGGTHTLTMRKRKT